MSETKILEELYQTAKAFVLSHYRVTDSKDEGIKILATMNQLIELRKQQK